MEPKELTPLTTSQESHPSQRIVVNVKKLPHFDETLPLPSHATLESAGIDIRACLPEKGSLTIDPFQRVLIPTGLAMEIPKGYEIQVRPRSGLSLKTPLFVCNSPGTIDSDYRGEIKIIMGNLSHEPYLISHAERIAQLILAPVIQGIFKVVKKLNDTSRGEGGLGHTGVN